MHTRQFSSQGTGWISAHIQSSCEEGQQLICLKCRGTNGSHCRQLVPGSGKVHLKLQRVELTSLLPRCVYPGATHSYYGQWCKEGRGMNGATNYRDNGERATWRPLLWCCKYKLDIHESRKASPIVLYIQLGITDREQKRCKNACSQFIRQPIAAPFVALWGRTRLSTVNPITVVTKIGQSVSKHTGCISAPA